MERYFASMFQDVRHEISLIKTLSLTDNDNLKQSNFTDYERNLLKNLAHEKLHRQRILKEYVASSFFSYSKMTTYPILNIEPELLKIKTRDDEIKNLKYQTEKHDHENIFKSLKIDNENYKRSIKVLIKRKCL